MIIAGASAYSRDIDFAKFREIADEVGAFLLADISHPSGLIATGLLSNPIPHCHVVTTTTHKTLRGPRGGLILMGEDFDNPFGITLKTEPFAKCRTCSTWRFSRQPRRSTRACNRGQSSGLWRVFSPLVHNLYGTGTEKRPGNGQSFVTRDYHLISGGTDNHLMLIDLRNKNVTGKDAELALVKAEITANKNMVPFDDKSPFVTSGIRVGTAAITTRGLKEAEMETIVVLIDRVINNYQDEAVLAQVAKEVHALMQGRALFNY